MDFMESGDKVAIPVQDKEPLSFKNAFWLIFGIIAFIQVFQFISALIYGIEDNYIPTEFLVYSDIMAIIWYALSIIIIHYNIKSQKYNPFLLYNFNTSTLFQHLPDVLKYFGGTALFVILFSLITKETELHLEEQPQFVILLSFVVTVIIAPVAEEIIFRGYLYSSMASTFKRKKERLVVNAMIFSAAHVFIISFVLGADIPYYIFVLGYLIALLYENSRSILPCIVLHALNNFLVFVIDIFKLQYFSNI